MGIIVKSDPFVLYDPDGYGEGEDYWTREDGILDNEWVCCSGAVRRVLGYAPQRIRLWISTERFRGSHPTEAESFQYLFWQSRPWMRTVWEPIVGTPADEAEEWYEALETNSAYRLISAGDYQEAWNAAHPKNKLPDHLYWTVADCDEEQ